MTARREVHQVPDRGDEARWDQSGQPSQPYEPDELDRSGLDDDRALARLEDVLLSLPFDRALPDLEVLLHRAGLDEELVRRDERVLKVLHEAILARPLGRLEEVTRVRSELELLTLEIELLTDRLADATTAPDVVAQALTRLTQVRSRLEAVRHQL
jgi:hypothetical protein